MLSKIDDRLIAVLIVTCKWSFRLEMGSNGKSEMWLIDTAVAQTRTSQWAKMIFMIGNGERSEDLDERKV